jgi:flagellar hook-associated protein 3 FlgL
MRVANLVPDAEYSMQQSEQTLAADLKQVATGLRVSEPSDDPAADANYALSLAASANVDQYTQNITSLSSQLQTADSSLSSMVSSLNSAVTLGTEGSTGTTSASNRQAIAEQVEGILSNVVAQANTTYQGAYLFGGSDTSTAPVVQAATSYSTDATVQPPLSATTPLSVGSVTTVTDASTGKTFTMTVTAGETISDVSAAVAGAVANGTLSAGTTAALNANSQLVFTSGSSKGIVVSSNDPVLGQISAAPGTQVANSYTYVGNSAINSVQVGDTLSVAGNLPGDQLFTSGANVVGALSGLVSALQTGTTTDIQNATTAVSTALSGLDQQRIPLDNTISELNSQESYLGQENVTLSSQQTSLVGADMATAATNLAQAETQNSAVLAAAARVLPESLLNYLPAQ